MHYRIMTLILSIDFFFFFFTLKILTFKKGVKGQCFISLYHFYKDAILLSRYIYALQRTKKKKKTLIHALGESPVINRPEI